MDCTICMEDYDQEQRAPKILPCGHTVCLQCLQGCAQGSRRQRCPTCRAIFNVSPTSLPNNFDLLRLIDQRADARAPLGWCSDCRAAAIRQCWDEHDVLSVKRALKHHLTDVLPQVAGHIQGLHGQCQEREAVQALTLLTEDAWDLTLTSGDHVFSGTVRNTKDPVVKALWLVVAAKAGLSKVDPLSERVAVVIPKESVQAQDRAAARRPTAVPTVTESSLRVLDVGLGMQQAKSAALDGALGVERLVGVHCHIDHAWCLQLLQRAAPTVERLGVYRCSRVHLQTVHAMPRLRRLHLTGDGDDSGLEGEPLVLPALPPCHGGLQWLSVDVDSLPHATIKSLLQAHSFSLEELVLQIVRDRSYRDLPSLLERCELRALRKLVLDRSHIIYMGLDRTFVPLDSCVQARADVRRVLITEAEVLCSRCDRVQLEEV
ncbi:uncharacterized protein LOC113213382 [Frankliniella occidentalis]|uniref:Uncharacterized protein LOC113213382 n=1 Tax=Frankliniella occidentalis TaxID=133901 RepID=A0A6J1T4H9_FRAOC|nr:uncharacterized protein LOC113213382 [Frankliniella occidentalis]